MPLPQVNDRLKEIPAQALRTVFATIGQFLLGADRFRARTGEQPAGSGEATSSPASEQAPAPAPAPKPAASRRAPAKPPASRRAPAKPAASRRAPARDAESTRWRSLDKTGNVRLLDGDEGQDEGAAPIPAASSLSEPAIAEPSVPEPVADATREPVPGPAGYTPTEPVPAVTTPAEAPDDPAPAVPDPADLAPVPDPADLAPAVPAPPHVASAEPAAPAAAATAGEALPVPNYDQLSLASLRARLRVLDAAQVQALLDYEKAHEGPAMITMFDRRLTKLTEGS